MVNTTEYFMSITIACWKVLRFFLFNSFYSTHGHFSFFSLSLLFPLNDTKYYSRVYCRVGKLSCGKRSLPSRGSCFSAYCPSSISSCGSGTRFWSVVPKDTVCELSLSSAAWSGTYWSGTLSPAPASGSGCTRFGPFSHRVRSYLHLIREATHKLATTKASQQHSNGIINVTAPWFFNRIWNWGSGRPGMGL